MKIISEQLLLRAKDVFMRHGLKSVTMDDLCKELRISKKTLYQHVHDKPNLIQLIVEREIAADMKMVHEIVEKKIHVIDELIAITNYTSSYFQKLHPATLYEMQKFYPDSWQLLENYRYGFLIDTIKANIVRGIESGIYLDDINPALIARLYSAKLDLLATLSQYPMNNISQPNLFFDTLKYHLRGICNAKGRRILQKKMTQMQS